MLKSFKLFPIGLIKSHNNHIQIEIYLKYQKALLGLSKFSHIIVSYWLHVNDTENKRNVFMVHPCGNYINFITGVFATHSPKRPNPIAISVCRLLFIRKNIIGIEDIDAINNSPVIDIKNYSYENINKSKPLTT